MSAVLVVGSAPLVPGWWTVVAGLTWLVGALGVGLRWRRTPLVLGISVGFLVIWMSGTLALR